MKTGRKQLHVLTEVLTVSPALDLDLERERPRFEDPGNKDIVIFYQLLGRGEGRRGDPRHWRTEKMEDQGREWRKKFNDLVNPSHKTPGFEGAGKAGHSQTEGVPVAWLAPLMLLNANYNLWLTFCYLVVLDPTTSEYKYLS